MHGKTCPDPLSCIVLIENTTTDQRKYTMSIRRVSTTIKPGADTLTIEAISHLYNYKLVAALRENIGNALDAMVEAGKSDTPIDVHIYPKYDALRFIISDTGVGMTADEVADNYLSVEVSRKRKRDDLIGGHGIGVLATFTSTDTLTVVTTKNGKTTLVTGNDHGGGDITWSLVESPIAHEQGTSIDFTAAVSGDDAAGVSQYLMLLSYMRNIRVHVHPLENEYDAPLWSLPIESLARQMSYVGSGMVDTADDGTLVIYPHGLIDDVSSAVTANDLDYIIGTRAGAVAVPFIASGKNRAPVSPVMAMVGGLPYRVNIESGSMDSGNFITVLSPDYITDNVGDFEVTTIPRNREYVEAKGYGADMFRERAFNPLLFSEQVRPYLNGVVDSYPHVLDTLDTDTAKWIASASSEHGAALMPTIEQALAHSIGATGPLGGGYAAGDYDTAPYIYQLRKIVLERGDDAQVAEDIAAAIKDRCGVAVFMNTHAATNADMERGISEDEHTTTAHAIEALRAVVAKYESKKDTAAYSALRELSSKLTVHRVSDALPGRLLTKSERRSLVAHHGRSAHAVVVIPDDVPMQEVAYARLYETLYNYLTNRRMSYSEYTGKADNMLLYDTWFTTSLFGREATGKTDGGYYDRYTSADFRDNRSGDDNDAEPSPVTWGGLSTKSSKRATSNAPEWSFTVLELHEDGSVSRSHESLTTKDFTKTMEDDSVFSMTQNHRSIREANVTPDPSAVSYAFRRGGHHETIARAGYAALYEAGYRKVYVYDDKTGTNPDKASRTDWIAPWREHAAPAVRAKAQEIIAEMAKKTYLAEFVTSAYSARYLPSQATDVADSVLGMALGTKYKKHVVKQVVGQMHADVMAAVYDQVKGTIPRQFVLPTAMPETDGTPNDYIMRNLARAYLDSYAAPQADIKVSQLAAGTMEALGARALTDQDAAVLSATLDATALTWNTETLDELGRIHADLARVWEATATDQEKERVSTLSARFYDANTKVAETPTEGEEKDLRDALIAALVPIVTGWVVNQWNMLLRLYSMRSDYPKALTGERITAMFAELEQVA